MSVKLWAPDHSDGCHISLTNGRTFMVPNHEDGIAVPKEFRRVAIARGCVPVAIERAVAGSGARDSPTGMEVPPRDPPSDHDAAVRPNPADKATGDHTLDAGLGDRTADEIMRRLRAAGDGGLTRTEISDVFTRHRTAEQIGTALDLLLRKGRATRESVKTGGRPTELWRPEK